MNDIFASGTPAVVQTVPESITCDIAIVGSGMGGGTVAWALRHAGLRVLVIERGDFLPREMANTSPTAVFAERRYANAEMWVNASNGKEFKPGVYYWVGGCTKVYGASLPRFRKEDFEARELADGLSPAWPISYDELEPYYTAMERSFAVHGAPGDPTDPPRSEPFPWPAVPHEPAVARLAKSMEEQGLHPFHMPEGLDLKEGGRCVRCRTCDGFPCRYGAKSDAETCGIGPALACGQVRLLTCTTVTRLVSSGRKIIAIQAERGNSPVTIRADVVVLAAGAVNTAALLLRNGLANSSGLVGRNYMVHNSTFMVGIHPIRRNGTYFQKSLGMNDWYHAGPDNPYPLGNLQMLGKLQGPMVSGFFPIVPQWAATMAMDRSMDVYLTTEDLPMLENRVEVLPDGRTAIHWHPTNMGPHRELVKRCRRVLRKAGYPLVFTKRMGIDTNSHQCGTAVMHHDGDQGVVNPDGRCHDLDNLYLADASVLPSSAAVNPALTIGTLALRMVDRAGWANPR